MNSTADVTVHVATFNTAAATELCIRSMRRTAGYPFTLQVGDSGSTDRTIEVLERFARQPWLKLELSGPRPHHDWLDLWLVRCSSRYAVFADSDVEFLRRGWLAELVLAAEQTDAVAVYTEMLGEQRNFVEFMVDIPGYAELLAGHVGRRVRLMDRPAPWLFLVNAESARRVGRKFAPLRVSSPAVREGSRTYDTGGAFFHELVARQLPWTLMPPSFVEGYRHYGSLSWIAHAVRDRRDWRLALHRLWIRRLIHYRLHRMRRLQRSV